QHEKQRGRKRGHAKLPAPLGCSYVGQGYTVVREIGEKDAEHHVELKQSDQSATPLRWSDLSDVHGTQNRRAAHAQSADKAEEKQGMPVPRQGTTQRRNHI